MKKAGMIILSLALLIALLAVPGVALAEQVEASTIGYHTVRWGETLFCIGRAYGVDPYAIAAYNGIPYPATIYAGQVLAIPNAPWGSVPAGPVCARQFGATYPAYPAYPAYQPYTPPVVVPPVQPSAVPVVVPTFIAPAPVAPPVYPYYGQYQPQQWYPQYWQPTGCSRTYVVQWGDSLGRIAASYGQSWQNLAVNNHIPNPNRIYAGQVICIP